MATPYFGEVLRHLRKLAATQTAALQYGPPSGGKHTLEETVLPLTRDTFGLVGTLGHEGPILRNIAALCIGAAGLI